MNEMPMRTLHQDLVLQGRKTSTLRGERYEAGVYKMVDKAGCSLGCVEVTAIAPQQLWWTALKQDELKALARAEGYPSPEGLKRELLRLGHKYFIQGKRGLWRHTLRASMPGDPTGVMA